jgi:probable addiction module antidote protein
MPKRTKSYETDFHERLRDPAYAMEYLRAALEDDDEGADAVFLLASRDVAQANHMTYVADATGLNRESLYKMLSRRGNPGINSLKAVLGAVGLKLSVQIAEHKQVVAQWTYIGSNLRNETAREIREEPGHIRIEEPVYCEVAGWEALANPPPDLASAVPVLNFIKRSPKNNRC